MRLAYLHCSTLAARSNATRCLDHHDPETRADARAIVKRSDPAYIGPEPGIIRRADPAVSASFLDHVSGRVTPGRCTFAAVRIVHALNASILSRGFMGRTLPDVRR